MVCGCTILTYKSIDSTIAEHEHYCIHCSIGNDKSNIKADTILCMECQKLGNCNFKEV